VAALKYRFTFAQTFPSFLRKAAFSINPCLLSYFEIENWSKFKKDAYNFNVYGKNVTI
jgi:hypothetical protein